MLAGFLVLSLTLATLAYFVPWNQVKHLISIIHVFLIAGLTIYLIPSVNQPLGWYMQADHISLIMLGLTALIGFISAIHYKEYADNRQESSRAISVHNGVNVLFLTALTGIALTNHFGMLWAFMEATTLTGAVLLYHDRDKLVLEAVWKYIFVASISVALAFVGILFLSLAPTQATPIDFSFDSVAEQAASMNPLWLKGCFLFVLTGFSIKMGVVPMFNVDIDAKDVSPSPVGAMFSSILLNAGFLSIFRFFSAFSSSEIFSWMRHVLILCGILSILIAAIYLLRVKNYKRIFAYSSMEHAGLVLLGLAMGKAGAIAALLHLILHSLVKSSLFFQFGDVFKNFQSKLVGQNGGYFFQNPLGGAIILLGLISVLALPPSGLFMSEFMLFQSFFQTGNVALAIGVMALLLLILFSMGGSISRLLFIHPKDPKPAKNTSQSNWLSVPQVLLISVSMYIGLVRPELIMSWVEQAVQTIP